MHPRVERWREIAQNEISNGAYPFPVELVLAIIDLESNGVAGAINPKSEASGLMQVMKNTLAGYNKNHVVKIPFEALQSAKYPAEQIRVGIWILGEYWKQAYRYLQPQLETVPVDELTKTADLFYAAGPGTAIPMLNRIKPPTFGNFEKRYPKSNMTAHAKQIWSITASQNPTWNLKAIDSFVGSKMPPPIIAKSNPLAGYAIAAILIATVFHFFLKEKKNSGYRIRAKG